MRLRGSVVVGDEAVTEGKLTGVVLIGARDLSVSHKKTINN
jgi:hypothetical protein